MINLLSVKSSEPYNKIGRQALSLKELNDDFSIWCNAINFSKDSHCKCLVCHDWLIPYRIYGFTCGAWCCCRHSSSAAMVDWRSSGITCITQSTARMQNLLSSTCVVVIAVVTLAVLPHLTVGHRSHHSGGHQKQQQASRISPSSSSSSSDSASGFHDSKIVHDTESVWRNAMFIWKTVSHDTFS